MTFDDILALATQLASHAEGKLAGIEDTSVNFHLTGSTPGTISAAVSGGKLTVFDKALPACDAQITASPDDIYAIMTGKLSPALAIMTGRLRISGNAGKLMRIMGALGSK